MGGSSPPAHSSFLPPPPTPPPPPPSRSPGAAHLVASAAAALFSETAAPLPRDEDSIDVELGVLGLHQLQPPAALVLRPNQRRYASRELRRRPVPVGTEGCRLIYMLVHAPTSPPPLDRQDLEGSESERLSIKEITSGAEAWCFLGPRCRSRCARLLVSVFVEQGQMWPCGPVGGKDRKT
ncbi:hypothetical protein GUJ93_ZPchr0004g39521 [Zizania palustris]|uniref:Uncharacterized protein n=1 Tax=Zizania palustris TaxID=103762 RepID=A0A8J5VZ58_ZIZPA|nr:hypothetical protein GUJ93_ZPchr0004g39521 [Zizania palustris]